MGRVTNLYTQYAKYIKSIKRTKNYWFLSQINWIQNLKFHKILNELIDINVLFNQGICILFNIQVIIIYPIKKYRKKSDLMRWMKLEPIIQSEVSQKEKHQYSILTHIYGI